MLQKLIALVRGMRRTKKSTAFRESIFTREDTATSTPSVPGKRFQQTGKVMASDKIKED
jgi:hypothetical protein